MIILTFQALVCDLEIAERLEDLLVLGPLQSDLRIHILQLVLDDVDIVLLSTHYLI